VEYAPLTIKNYSNNSNNPEPVNKITKPSFPKRRRPGGTAAQILGLSLEYRRLGRLSPFLPKNTSQQRPV
jgi:hypothetical protein